MSAFKTDAGHGTVTHYRRGCRCEDCTRGAARYEQERQLDLLADRPRRVPILGSRRRLQALVALGYDWKTLGRELGVSDTMVSQWGTVRTWMYRGSAERVAAVYDRLSMTLPPAETTAQKNAVSRARGRARRAGWPPPLAWDDIDNDPRPPRVASAGAWETQVDHAVVRRVIDGGPRPRKLTRAECGEIVAGLLARGFSTHQIENDFGFKVERHRAPERVAS